MQRMKGESNSPLNVDLGGKFRERNNTFNHRLPGELSQHNHSTSTPFFSPSGKTATSSGCLPFSIPTDPMPMLEGMQKESAVGCCLALTCLLLF